MQVIKTSHMDNRAASWKLFNSFNSKIYPEEKISEKQRHCSSHEPFWILPTIQRVDTAQRASYGSPHSLKSTTYATMHCKLSNAANWIPACNESQVLGIFRNTDGYLLGVPKLQWHLHERSCWQSQGSALGQTEPWAEILTTQL
jgi:hypothetical protein